MPDRERTATGISPTLRERFDWLVRDIVDASPEILQAIADIEHEVTALEAERDRLDVLEEMTIARSHFLWREHGSLREAADAELRRRADAR